MTVNEPVPLPDVTVNVVPGGIVVADENVTTRGLFPITAEPRE